MRDQLYRTASLSALLGVLSCTAFPSRRGDALLPAVSDPGLTPSLIKVEETHQALAQIAGRQLPPERQNGYSLPARVLRPLIDACPLEKRVELIAALIPHAYDVQVERLIVAMLRRSQTLDDLHRVVTGVGIEPLLRHGRVPLKELVAHSLVTRAVAELPSIADLPPDATPEAALQLLEALKNRASTVLGMALADRQFLSTQAVQELLDIALRNHFYLEIEGAERKNDPAALVEFARMMRVKCELEYQYGILLAHTQGPADRERWIQAQVPPSALPTLGSAPSYYSGRNETGAREWRRVELEELRLGLTRLCSDVLPMACIQTAPVVLALERAGVDPDRRGLAYLGGKAQVFDGAAETLSQSPIPGLPLTTHLAGTAIHELTHLLTYGDPEFGEFVKEQGGWQEFMRLEEPKTRDGVQWLTLPSGKEVPLEKRVHVDGIERIYVLDDLYRWKRVYSFCASSVFPCGFSPGTGPAHIPTFLVQLALEDSALLRQSSVWRDVLSDFWGRPKGSVPSTPVPSASENVPAPPESQKR